MTQRINSSLEKKIGVLASIRQRELQLCQRLVRGHDHVVILISTHLLDVPGEFEVESNISRQFVCCDEAVQYTFTTPTTFIEWIIQPTVPANDPLVEVRYTYSDNIDHHYKIFLSAEFVRWLHLF